jgi:hypothetical protein
MQVVNRDLFLECSYHLDRLMHSYTKKKKIKKKYAKLRVGKGKLKSAKIQPTSKNSSKVFPKSFKFFKKEKRFFPSIVEIMEGQKKI